MEEKVANISYADGTITVEGIPKNEIKKFWEVFVQTQAGTEYGEYCLSSSPCRDIERFYGFGRWLLSTNLESFGKWAKQILKREKKEESLKWLEERAFTLTFDYSEEECGMRILHSVSGVVRHEANTPLEKCAADVQSEEEYDYNAYGLTKLELEDVSSRLESLSDNPEWIQEELERSLKSAKSCGEKVEDVVELLKDFENYTDENGVAYDVRKEYEKVLAA